ncbi:MAG: tRNA (adenosine(37)-N6)-threonylcarbamoyltransferase complex ATPase subunit type 1 TsaE [Omnitrophica bacterium]|nr:tRNA (adenosine(37)-N6)-threonylcarbamoyltransferase complex ATPase subunit type 1 TsaE [Candidatus Omnitrophota bacterium]
MISLPAMINIRSNSCQETIDCGEAFSQALEAKDIVILEGDLGGGKTTFVKGILKGFNFKRRVLSPSFTLIRQYSLKNLLIYHFDLYRIDAADLFDLGAEDLFYSQKSISLIEWGNKIKKDLLRYIQVKFLFSAENKRCLIFSTKGYKRSKIESILKAVKIRKKGKKGAESFLSIKAS